MILLPYVLLWKLKHTKELLHPMDTEKRTVEGTVFKGRQIWRIPEPKDVLCSCTEFLYLHASWCSFCWRQWEPMRHQIHLCEMQGCLIFFKPKDHGVRIEIDPCSPFCAHLIVSPLHNLLQVCLQSGPQQAFIAVSYTPLLARL